MNQSWLQFKTIIFKILLQFGNLLQNDTLQITFHIKRLIVFLTQPAVFSKEP